ncbi:1-phosphatidylinositol 4,5-bisphosphate phosphodiesterase eta-2 isoform X1 [Haemorhous mexicanus]|uniref:1-phosphatidylinositol 4,5-bisphosphate phosphodiesterase eta-2 isoform X1 n=1 Tax=Haemorhous mexicanus TaxID=30427 RepID=UPI0028BD53F7|nr:1-phosphatidylinositol 4,5-bisphosphate phosphodiesterase eta-2 isoform X1 [Haemorhous mexicanus]XP_059722604.1 1-phosphatidylinositol 4,5-bisphosphate phosphodiesterase eta-2 isoform X1 [Haemorhous mexicanus]XP_059722605.1 1-phosphatidylinositol 4,5-bisphosphate phosphodiesterase eta-2 isoform X1 [Haemorhous mexicanus]
MALTSPKSLAGDLTQREESILHEGNCCHFLSANILSVVERCMSSMQAGTQMIKLRGGSKGLVRFYYLDDHRSCIRWRPSRKNEKAKISIDSIQEVCEGKQSEIFQRYADGSFDPNCCFSIYYGDHMESLDLVSSSAEEARTWITGLKYLMAGISDEDSLSKRQRTRDQWLKQTFDEADKNGDGSLSISEVLQLMHKLNVNLPRQKVKQMFKEADTDDNQGTLDFEEFCAFYKMMSTRRDLYLLMLTYSNHKDYLDTDDLKRFLETEQKMTNVTKEHCLEIISKFEPCPENKKEGALGIDGFTNYMRSPSGDIFNPEHYQVNQDMSYPLSHYFITSSHNTYLMGDQLMSQSRVDMYAWVLQSGCRCVEVDCWDGPDGEPIVHHGYTLTSKILFKDVIETINKYAFIKNEYPVILSIENHCSIVQQKKMAQYLTEILGDKLDLSSVHNDDSTKLPSPASLKGKILVKGKKLPANISDDAEEGEVSDEDSADEIDDDCKLMNGDASANRKRVENIAKKKLDSLIKESKIRDCEDPNNFTVSTLPSSGKAGLKSDSKKSKLEDDAESGEDFSASKRHSRSLMGSFSKRKKKGSKLKKASSLEEGEDDSDSQGNLARSSVHYSRVSRQKKTMKLSRALSDLVKYTKSVGIHDVETEISSSWQVSSFSETKAHQILQQKPAQYLRFNQHQLSRIYPSSYRVDSSNYNPQPFWNAGCQLVALNYQSEGRMLQLNRAKFSANGNCGYVLKPNCMCQGVFNPNSEDPLPGQLKKQLVLRIISGQQLPKPRDSMLGDRGEIIDPFVEVEVIGLPVDCFKEQTRVVDDNGFNPMWEETLVFTVHMPEIALIRFLVWDHDPIGRDFIGQRTIAFSSMMPGYRHVYLEGIEEASIFVHVAINDICGKAKQALGLKGLFLRNPKQASLDSHAAGQLHRKHSFSSHILRRTASAPTKSQKKNKKGFPEIAFDTKDSSSAGAGEGREVEAASQPRFVQEPESASPSPAPRDGAAGEAPGRGLKGKAQGCPQGPGQSCAHPGAPFSEPLPRAHRVRLQEPQGEKPSVFARCAINSSGRIGVATNCMKCMIGSKESPDPEGPWSDHPGRSIVAREPLQPGQGSSAEERVELHTWVVRGQPRPLSDLQPCSSPGTAGDLRRSSQALVSPGKTSGDSKCHGLKAPPRQRWQCHSGGKYGSTVNLVAASNGSVSSNSSSLESLGSPEFPKHWSEPSRRQVGTLQREMNALFVQKLEEIRSKSPIFFTDVCHFSMQRSVTSLCSLETITEEPVLATESHHCSLLFPLPVTPYSDSEEGSGSDHSTEAPSEGSSTPNQPQEPPPSREQGTILAAEDQGQDVPKAADTGLVAPEDERTRVAGCPTVGNGWTQRSEAEEQGGSAARLVEAADHGAGQPVGNCQKQNQPGQVLADTKSTSVCKGQNPRAAAVPPQQSSVSNSPQADSPQKAWAAQALPVPVPQTSSYTLARRPKSEGLKTSDSSALIKIPSSQSPAAEVYFDATVNDRIWSKLDCASHRDSMSSSSSMSSNDTVIDLSLPSLARKSLPDLGIRQDSLEPLAIRKGMRPRSATACSNEMPMVSKSKSNPNLRSGQLPADELCPRPLARSPQDAFSSIPRRHTWSRLYMESLRQSSNKSKAHDTVVNNQAKSKSLGDLTSDDIVCTFESKYRSISRSFVTRSMREQRRSSSLRPSAKSRDELTEQLKKLTAFQQENDITSPIRLEPSESEEEGESVGLLRRSSSRSQSRVRYIANRARQAQERQRLQGRAQLGGSPIEERGNPEGACSVGRAGCTDPAAHTALAASPKGQPECAADTEVFFMLKL